jgi:long-subunit acyl-CoA synthetase (AMP-forming)
MLPGAQQVVLVGNGRGYVCALVTGAVKPAAVQAAIEKVNLQLPHYRQIRNFATIPAAFSAENGLLTAMGKLRREAIHAHYAKEIAAMYERSAHA